MATVVKSMNPLTTAHLGIEFPENLLLFRTDIKTKKKVKRVKPVLSNHPHIKEWNIDTEDIDNVLRIESTSHLHEQDVIVLMNACGFQCEVLPD